MPLVLGMASLALALAPNLSVALPLTLVLGIASITYLTGSTAVMQFMPSPRCRGASDRSTRWYSSAARRSAAQLPDGLCDSYGQRVALVVAGGGGRLGGRVGLARGGRRRGRSLDARGRRPYRDRVAILIQLVRNEIARVGAPAPAPTR